MYLGNDGGVWRTDDAEATPVTWTNLNNPGLTLTQFYPFISINASSPSMSFGGTQDNGSQNYQGPGASWVDNQQCGDGGTTAVDSVVPSTVYIGCITGFPVNASYQNGAIGTFSPAVNGINPNDFFGIIPPLAADPSSGNTVYFGTTKVYQSTDAGNTWTPISNDLVSGFNGDSLTVLAVAPANPAVVYAGANTGNSVGQLAGQVFAATNVTQGNFASFFQVSGQGSLPPRALTSIAVDPADTTGKTAYVTFSGFAFVNANFGVNDPKGHIFKTTDGGTTWQDVSCSVAVCTTPAATDLPNIPVNDLVIDPDVPGTIYAATDLGVFVGSCSASLCTWSTLSTGLPRVVVLSLRLHEPSRTLRAGTHGRGAWDINLNNFSFTGPHISSISPISANAGASSPLTLTVYGSGLTGGSVQWNGSATGVTTTQVNDNHLTASLPASLFSAAGTFKVTVLNGPTSNALTFSVLAATPTLSSCTSSMPAATSAACGTPVQTTPSTAVAIQVTGTNFAASAKVLFNGAHNGITVAAPTAACPLPTCLTATLPAALLGPYGSTDSISVSNLPPGGGQSKPLNFQVVAPPPPNDNFANAINITTLTFNDAQDSSGATTEATDPTPPCAQQLTPAQGNTAGHPNGAYNTIWYKFTPQFSANLYTSVDTQGSSYDTVLSLWTGTQGALTNIACNDDINPGIVVQSQISQLQNIPLVAGTTYYIMVSSFGPPDPNPIALGGKSQLDFLYNDGFNPAPTLTSVSPNSANSGDPNVTLTITGSGFLNGAFAQFTNGYSGYTTTVTITTTLQTTLVSSTQLTAVLPASVIALPTNGQISVSNPQPQYGGSNFLPFTVNLGTYPVPGLNSISPNSALAGSIPFTISANGSNFANTAVLNFNGAPKPTSVQNSQSLTATISTTDVASAGTAQVTVSNPTPGGGASAPQSFTITQPTVVPTISSVSPSTAPANTSVNLTITGTNFMQGASLYFVGINYGTNVSSSTQLTATIQTPVGPGSYPLYVVDPTPAGTAAPFSFVVTAPPDFSITSSGTTTQTVTAGAAATFTNAISVSAQNGFASQVNLSCSLPATATTCTVNPNTFATGSGTATVTAATTSRALVPPSAPFGRFYLRPQWVPLFALTILLAIFLLRFARTKRQRLVGTLPFAVLTLFFALQAVGCGGGGYSSPPPPTGTPAGTYTITVTGTSGNLTHTATLTLTVN